MFNVWKFKDTHRAKLTDINGVVCEGIIISRLSSEDLEDIVDNPEDEICIENDSGIYSFRASQIAEMTSLDNFSRESAPARKARTFSQVRQSAAQNP